MSSLNKLFAEIESTETAVRTGVVSGYRLFLSALDSLPAVRELKELCKKEEAAVKVLQRVLRISEYSIDTRFENPLDTAIAAYLYILGGTNPRLARIATVAVQRAVNCWWAPKVADAISATLLPSKTEDSSLEIERRIDERIPFYTATSLGAAAYVFATAPSSQMANRVFYANAIGQAVLIHLPVDFRTALIGRSDQFILITVPKHRTALEGFASSPKTFTEVVNA
jgi:hypothetical protein